jgi:hypothetical protein
LELRLGPQDVEGAVGGTAIHHQVFPSDAVLRADTVEAVAEEAGLIQAGRDDRELHGRAL